MTTLLSSSEAPAAPRRPIRQKGALSAIDGSIFRAQKILGNANWHPWIFEARPGELMMIGAVCPTTTRGINKGWPNYRKADRTTKTKVFISASGLDIPPAFIVARTAKDARNTAEIDWRWQRRILSTGEAGWVTPTGREVAYLANAINLRFLTETRLLYDAHYSFERQDYTHVTIALNRGMLVRAREWNQ
jgi:hypothetical protein